MGGDLEYEALFDGLAEDIRGLAGGRSLRIVQFTADGLVLWNVRRDEAGTPHASFWPPLPWSDFLDLDVLSGPELNRAIRPGDGSRLVLVCGAPDDSYARRAYELMARDHSRAPTFVYRGSLEELLRNVLVAIPLIHWYELVVLRRTPSGRVELTGVQLFPPGARRGEKQSFTVRCEPSGEAGTVFAVVATESVDEVHLVSAKSASVIPGTYNLTAVLGGPGLVRFDGLATRMREERRTWSEIVATVPDRLSLSRSAHLICAVEVSGPRDLVGDRIERAKKLIRDVSAGSPGLLKFSLVTYGPHAVGRMFPEEPIEVLAWAQDGMTALHALNVIKDRIRTRGTTEAGYVRAAQLECVLAKVADELQRHSEREARPVLVTIASRSAFPHQLDPASEIIPCPVRNDWRKILKERLAYPGIAFGLISDHEPDEEIWTHLSHDAFASMNGGVFNVPLFAEKLGLLSEGQDVPFPLIEPERSSA
jgi:hypothetical protein